MTGQATPAQLAGLLVGLSMKGERPEEIVGLARTMRAHAVPLDRRPGDVFDTCGTGGDRAGTIQHLYRRRHRAGGGWRACRQARQPVGLEPLRQRGRVRGAGRQHHRAAARGRAQPGRSRRRVPLRAGVSSSDEACRADAQRAGPAHGVQPARPADEPGRAVAADRRRAAARAHGAGGARAADAGLRAGVGRPRRRRPRRDLEHRLHEGLRRASTAWCARSTCTRATSG